MAPLGADTAAKIAQGIERQRLKQPNQLPYSDILESIRPKLREARPPRTPTVLRLVCDGFEEFLVNQRGAEKRVGEIPRSTISLVWLLLQNHADSKRLTDYAGVLSEAVRINDDEEVDLIGRTIREIAAEILASEISEWPDDEKKFPKIRALGRALTKEETADVREVAAILAIADPIDTTIAAIEEASPLSAEDLRDRMLRLDETLITIAKAAYLELSAKVGNDAKYLAISLMQRLENPAEILALPRALALNRQDGVMHNSELAILGDRLLYAMEIDAKRIGRLAREVEPDGSNFPLHGDELTILLARLQAQFLGMTTEIDVKKSGPWGTRLLNVRREVASGMEETFIEASMAAMLISVTFDPDYPEPTPEETRGGVLGEQFLTISLKVSDTLGFGGVMRTAMRELQKGLDHQVDLTNRALKGIKDEALYKQGIQVRKSAVAMRNRLWPDE